MLGKPDVPVPILANVHPEADHKHIRRRFRTNAPPEADLDECVEQLNVPPLTLTTTAVASLWLAASGGEWPWRVGSGQGVGLDSFDWRLGRHRGVYPAACGMEGLVVIGGA